MNNLALTYQSLARYTEAEPLYRRAIEIDEKVLGKDHPDVAIRYNNLAGLLQDQGKYAEAEPLYRRAIEIDEKALGKDHPDVAIRYNNLAVLLQDQGKYDRGRAALSAGHRDRRKGSRQGSSRRCNPLTTTSPHCFRTRASMPRPSRSIGGPSRSTKRFSARIIPTVATRYNNLAVLLQDQGKYAEAEPLYRRAIEIDEKALGKDHPDVAIRYNNLADLLQDQGKYDRGRAALSAGHRDRRKVLGKDHPNVAIGYNNLAVLLQDQGKYAEAEPLYRRAIEIDEKALGKDHPNVANRLQQSRLIASGPGQVCRGRAALSAGDRDIPNQTWFGPSKHCHGEEKLRSPTGTKKTEFRQSRSVMRFDGTEVLHQFQLCRSHQGALDRLDAQGGRA